jgi:hypothetical protein
METNTTTTTTKWGAPIIVARHYGPVLTTEVGHHGVWLARFTVATEFADGSVEQQLSRPAPVNRAHVVRGEAVASDLARSLTVTVL